MAETMLFIMMWPLLVFGYFFGSIPFGLILSKFFLKVDVREIGSGNIGATNVLRAGSKKLALATLLLDAFKGVVAILTFKYFLASFAYEPCAIIDCVENCHCYPDFVSRFDLLYVGFGVVIGHCFPVWLKFKGGKGVATTFGVLFAAVPWAGFIAAVTWGIVAGFTRYSSLSALCAVAIAPLVTFIYYGAMPAAITVLIAALVIWRHKDNIKRLMDGTETKIGDKKNGSPA